MSYDLILLRHGKSDWHSNSSDFNRPVTDRGKRGAQRIGVWLAKNNLIPDRVISSPAQRAKLTAEKMLKAMAGNARDIIYEQGLYEGELNDILAILHNIPAETKKVVLVGHNPDLEMLLFYLSDKKIPLSADGKLLTTATAAHLSLSCPWNKIESSCAELISIQRAKKLPEGFPYPDFNSTEQRIRPAYYYSQSSVIPYRYHKGKLEILLVLSSSKKHYIIPKGIIEPGLSARESAAKEALEEAGIKGNTTLEPVAHYYYRKWQARCKVSVYLMEVIGMLNEDDWEESYRSRQWFKVDIAAQKIKQQALKPILIDLNKLLP